jgi:mRNA-degrading endonuclease toxin of MazEF toxin-antitoxin module
MRNRSVPRNSRSPAAASTGLFYPPGPSEGSLRSNAKYAEFPGNVTLPARATGLPKDSVAVVSQVVTLDRSQLSARVGRLSPTATQQVLAGVQLVLGP